jgi:hypothetical protein
MLSHHPSAELRLLARVRERWHQGQLKTQMDGLRQRKLGSVVSYFKSWLLKLILRYPVYQHLLSDPTDYPALHR